MNQATDPLQGLIGEDLRSDDRERLASLLTPYVSFDKNSEKPVFKRAIQEMGSNANKVELVFLAEKARALLFPNATNEGLGQSEIIALDIMPEGSVKSTLKKLFDTKQIRKSSNGKYVIPNYRILELQNKYEAKE